MPRQTTLDKRWQELMALCAKEKEFRSENRHPKLVKLITEQITEVASEMGFSERQIATREFRAVRNGEHIARIVTE